MLPNFDHSDMPRALQRLLARNNEVLATATSSVDGSVVFEPGLQNGTGGDAPALVVAQSAESDYSFVDLTLAQTCVLERGVHRSGGPLNQRIDQLLKF